MTKDDKINNTKLIYKYDPLFILMTIGSEHAKSYVFPFLVGSLRGPVSLSLLS